MKLEDILAQMGELRTELEELGSVETPSDEQKARFGEAMTEHRSLKTQKEEIEERARQLDEVRRESALSAATKPEARVSGDGAFNKNVNVRKSNDDSPYNTRGLIDPRALNGEMSDEASQVRGEYRDRARRAIEASRFVDDKHQQSAMRHIDNDASGIVAAHVLKTGSPAYRSAFNKYLANPAQFGWQLNEEERTAMSTTGGNGGFLIPFTLDPTIILTNDGATNPFRGIATVKTTMTNSWNGVSSAGVTAEWLGENTGAADASPTFLQPSIPVYKAAAFVQASFEVVEDSGVAGDIAMLIADARDRLEATAFAVGTGSTQPTGAVTAVAAVTASRVSGSSGAAGAADFVLADVYALANALPPRYRTNSSWVAEQTILNRVRRFGEGVVSNAAFWADLGVAIPPLLLGRPVHESSAMDNTIVSGSNDDILLIGDFKAGYYIVDRIGMTLAYEPLMKAQSTGRPDGSVGWFAHWRVGGTAVNANAFRLLRI